MPPFAHSRSWQLVDGYVTLVTSLGVNVNISSVIGGDKVVDTGVDERVKNVEISSRLVTDGVVSSFGAVTSSKLVVILSISDVTVCS